MSRLEETRPTGHGRARGLVSSRVSGARVDARTFAPPPELAPLVESLWLGRWDLPLDAPHHTRLLGDPCVHVVLAWDDGPRPPDRLVGVWTRIWENTLRGRGTVRAAKLRAGAAGALVADASQLRNAVVALSDHFTDAPPRHGLTGDPSDDAEAFSVLTAWLQRHLVPENAAHMAIVACERLRTDPGLLRVGQLSEAMDCSERVLQRLFRRHVGAAPKALIRRHRLQEAAVRMERGETQSLAELALRLGYADQAHFARDWKAAVAISASRFRRDVHR